MAKRHTTRPVDGELFTSLIEGRKAFLLARDAKVGIQTIYKMKRGGDVEFELIERVARVIGFEAEKLIRKPAVPAMPGVDGNGEVNGHRASMRPIGAESVSPIQIAGVTGTPEPPPKEVIDYFARLAGPNSTVYIFAIKSGTTTAGILALLLALSGAVPVNARPFYIAGLILAAVGLAVARNRRAGYVLPALALAANAVALAAWPNVVGFLPTQTGYEFKAGKRYMGWTTFCARLVLTIKNCPLTLAEGSDFRVYIDDREIYFTTDINRNNGKFLAFQRGIIGIGPVGPGFAENPPSWMFEVLLPESGLHRILVEYQGRYIYDRHINVKEFRRTDKFIYEHPTVGHPETGIPFLRLDANFK